MCTNIVCSKIAIEKWGLPYTKGISYIIDFLTKGHWLTYTGNQCIKKCYIHMVQKENQYCGHFYERAFIYLIYKNNCWLKEITVVHL